MSEITVVRYATNVGVSAPGPQGPPGIKSYATDVGDGSSTALVVTHNLNSRDVSVTVRRSTSPYDEVIVDNEATTVNTVTLRFAVAPTTGQYRCIVRA